jgi:hypothetical protein
VGLAPALNVFTLQLLLRVTAVANELGIEQQSCTKPFQVDHRRQTKKETRLMPRKSSPDLFSISAAADALSRSRRTVTRALKNIKPDAVESGLAKWSMKTIISAIDKNTQAPINNPRAMSHDVAGLENECNAAFELFDVAFEAMIAAKPLAKRRALASAVGPLLRDARELMLERDIADGLHEEHAALRSERIYTLTLHTMERICDWRGSMSAFNILNREDEAEAA